MVIAIDKSLLLLEDELVAKCSFLSFSSNIDAIAISNSGNLIVCGLTDGEVHGVYIKGLLLFSVSLRLEDVSISDGTFTSIQQLGKHFYFTCRNGSVYWWVRALNYCPGFCSVHNFSIPPSLSEIDESSLESVFNISVNDNETVAAVLDDVTIQRTSTGKAMAKVDSALLLKQLTAHSYAENNQENQRTDHDLIITGSQGTINYRTVSKDTTRINIPSHFGSIKQIFNMEHYMYVDILLKIQTILLIRYHT